MPLFGKKKKLFNAEESRGYGEQIRREGMFGNLPKDTRKIMVKKAEKLAEDSLNFEVKLIKKQYEIRTPEGEELAKTAVKIGHMHGEPLDSQRPVQMFGVLKELSNKYGYDRLNEKINELTEKAKRNNLKVGEELFLDVCTPQQKERILSEAQKHGLPILDVGDFLLKYPEIDERIRQNVFEKAKEVEKFHDSELTPVALFEYGAKKSKKWLEK